MGLLRTIKEQDEEIEKLRHKVNELKEILQNQEKGFESQYRKIDELERIVKVMLMHTPEQKFSISGKEINKADLYSIYVTQELYSFGKIYQLINTEQINQILDEPKF